MITDNGLYFSDEQAVCNDGQTEYATNAIDVGSAVNMAKGEPLGVFITVDEVFAGTGTTLTISLVTATASDQTTGQEVLYSTPAIAKASLTAGRDPIILPIPPLLNPVAVRGIWALSITGMAHLRLLVK
jgi:hypothetical protein